MSMSDYNKNCNCETTCPKREANIFDTDSPTIRGLMQERDEIQALYIELQERLADREEYIAFLKETVSRQSDEASRMSADWCELNEKYKALSELMLEISKKMNLFRANNGL